MAERVGTGDGAFAPSTESTQKSSRPLYRLWTPGELERVLAHPEMTAAELAATLPGRTAKAVRRIRERHGRRAAAYLGVGRSTVDRWRRDGRRGGDG